MEEEEIADSESRDFAALEDGDLDVVEDGLSLFMEFKFSFI